MNKIVFPKLQRNHNYINRSIDQWLDIHFGDTSFNGRVVIGHRKNGGGIYTMTVRALTELRPYVKLIHASHRLDYYITANTVSGVNRRKDELFGLQNIVIDIDCHSDKQPHAVASLVQAFIWRSKRDLWGTGVIPTPNSIVRTGRGIQLWWAIQPCYGGSDYGVSLYHYNKIKNNIMDHIEAMLDDYTDELAGLEVDRGASSNPVGYFRLPFTYNTTAKREVTLEILHDKRYDQRELTRMEGVTQYANATVPRTKRHISLQETDRKILRNYQSTGVRRVMQLIKLRNLRNNVVGSEMRDHFNFSVYNALRMKFDHAEAMVYLREYNEGFKNPMTEKELENCVSTAARRGGYKYTNRKLIELLDITPEEQSAIGLLPFVRKRQTKPNASRDEVRKALRDDRDMKILELADKGISQAETARILGIGKNTVWRVLKRVREMIASVAENYDIDLENAVSKDENNRHQYGSIYVYLLPTYTDKSIYDIGFSSLGRSRSGGEAWFPIPLGDSS